MSLGADKTEVIRALAGVVAEAGRTTDPDGLAEPTRWPARPPRRPACPAASRSRTAAPSTSTCPRSLSPGSPPATDFGAKDGPADLAFLIAAPAGGDATHLKLLTQLARALVKKGFTDSLRSATSPAEVAELVAAVVASKPAAAPAKVPAAATPAAAPAATAPTEAAPAAPPVRRSLVAVTACPTGIAHTYMAAEALEAAAERAGVDIAVETQGSARFDPARPRR